MIMSVVERFLSDNEMLSESPIECDLKVGDIVTFTNEYDVSFENCVIIGFAKPEHFLHGRFIHLNTSAPWFPHKRDELTLTKRLIG